MDSLQELKQIKIKTPFVAQLFFYGAAFPWFTAWQNHNFNWQIAIVCAAISIPALAIGSYLAHIITKPKQERRDELAQEILGKVEKGSCDTFFLYLRPFSTTGQMSEKNANLFDFTPPPELEETLTNRLTEYGPVVCLGAQLEAYGATRVLTTEEQWQEKFLFLMEKATFIFMIPGYQEGITWEMGKLFEHEYLDKTAFIVPVGDLMKTAPDGQIEMGESSKKHWQKTQVKWKEAFNLDLPKYSGEQVFQITPDREVKHVCVLPQLSSAKRASTIFRSLGVSNK